MTTNFKYLGHAGFWIRTPKVDILMDPWFSPSGAFHFGWFQWPPNQNILPLLINDLKNSNRQCFIYISHEHEDHLCKYSIKKIIKNKSVTFIIPDFEEKSFENTIKTNFKKNNIIQVIKNNETLAIKDFELTMFVDDQGINHDSSIILSTDDFTFFNQNDCKIFDRLDEILNFTKKIDFYSCQFSGANWHPSTFIMDENEKKQISLQRNKQKFYNIAQSILKLSCSNYIASAGPVCFLDPKEDFINKNIYNFPHAETLFKFLNNYFLKINFACNLLTPLPGERIKESNKIIMKPEVKDLENYRKNNFKGRPNFKVEEKQIINFLNNKLNKIKNIIPACNFQGPIIFSLKDNNYLVDFIKIKIRKIKEKQFPKKYIRVFASEWWFKLMVNNERGQSLCLTMHPRLIRKNPYCVFQNLFLFTNLNDIQTAFEKILNISDLKCIVTLDDGKKFKIRRYCPHQGADLENVEIKNGILTCPRHNISFNIYDKGNALNGINLSLDAEKIK